MIFTSVWIGIQSTPEVAYFNAQSYKDTLAGFDQVKNIDTAYEFYRQILPNVFYESKAYDEAKEEFDAYNVDSGECLGRTDGQEISNDICTLENNVNTQLLFGKACFI